MPNTNGLGLVISDKANFEICIFKTHLCNQPETFEQF
jgi:hypothetical protein